MIQRLAASFLFAMLFATVLACGPPPFVLHVTFQGEVDVVEGAPVVYEGVAIGEVADVALRQADPGRRALVAVTLEIDDPQVTLREHDRFHLGSLRGVPVVEIVPVATASVPLASGAVVAGEPPLVTQMYETLGAAIESIGDIAAEAIEEALGEIERQDGRTPGSSPKPAQP